MKFVKKIVLSFIILLSILYFVKPLMVNAGEPVSGLPTCYKQNDPRWGSHVNGNGTIASSACGLLSLTNTVNYLTGNFIYPVELADYAYSINAYNTPEGGGTWREVLYRDIADFEFKYGFKVDNPSIWATVKDARLRDHLKKGGAAVGHVDGHFIGICGYDESTNSYLIFDSAANVSSRSDYVCGTWMTESELSGDVAKMIIDWFCLISNNTKRNTTLDGYSNLRNGKAEATFYVTKGDKYSNNPLISGSALTDDAVVKYYYIMDYDYDHPHMLNPYKLLTNTGGYVVKNEEMTGFNGVIETSDLSLGTHYANVFAKTETGKLINIAEIQVKVGKNALYQDNKMVIDMSYQANDTDILSSWSAAGFSDYVFQANYSTVVDLGRIDLSKYKQANIYYTTDSSFVSNKSGTQSIIGLKWVKSDFGYYGRPVDKKGAIGYANMTNGTAGGWNDIRVATIDLSNSFAYSPVFLNGYNQESAFYAVTKVEFIPNDDYTLPSNDTVTSFSGVKEVTPTNNYLGTFDLSEVGYFEFTFSNNFDGTLCLYDENNTMIALRKGVGANKLAINANLNTVSKVYYQVLQGSDVSQVSVYDINQDPFYEATGDFHSTLQYHDNFEAVYSLDEHSVCEEISPATCTEPGTYRSFCIHCGKEILNTVLLPLGHESSKYQSVPANHYKICDRCGIKFDVQEHEYTKQHNEYYHYDECVCGYVNSYKHHTFNDNHVCTDCGYECTHEYTTKINGKKASCTSTGLTDGEQCTICDAIVRPQEEIPKSNHTYVDGVCKYCGDILQVTPEKPTEPSKPKKGCRAGALVCTNLSLYGLLFIILKKKS